MTSRLLALGFTITLAAVDAASASQSDPFLWPYNQPTNIRFETATIAQAWQEWKAAQITGVNAGGNGRLRVLGGVDNVSTVSEGQGYGMLFASVFDDQATLDGLWLFTLDHLNPRGLMDWHIGNPGQRLGIGAATDGDEDIALSLINACIKVQRGSWRASAQGIDYCAHAGNLVAAIRQYEIDRQGSSPPGGLPDNPGHELLPGDAWNPSIDFPEGIVNLSYFAPGYYTVFGKFTNDEAEWNAVNVRNYEIVNLAQGKPGNCSKLVPNWNQYDGDAQTVPWQPNNSGWWSYDAARFAWRVAVDKSWYGNTEARATTNEIGSFFSSVGLSAIGEHSMDGWRTGSGPWSFFVANAGVAIWAADRLSPVNCGAAAGSLKETPQSAYDGIVRTKDAPNSYYGNAWRLLSMLLMTGNFPNFFEMAAGRTPSPAPPPGVEPPPVPPPPPPPPPPSAACAVNYEIVARWNGGFHANITVINRGSTPVSGYALSWTFTANERFSSGWNASYVQNGSSMTASNTPAHWNGTIGANGGSLMFGFIGAGNAGTPSGFTLNGSPCM